MNKYFLFIGLVFITFSKISADEGMWIPSLVYKLNIKDMQSLGCKLDAEEIYSINNSSLKDVVVALDRGSCTAELVSATGLIFTNHHCGESDIQKHSTVEHNYLKDGFWARSNDEELPNPGKSATFLIRMEDVTEKVFAGVTEQMGKEEREDTIRKAISTIEKEASADSHYEVNVQSLFNDNKYFLFVSETFRDIRLVACPPESLGRFGGETDNWMWPRHTADFCMFRIYTGPDGKPASYSKENIPLKSKNFLPVSLNGIEKGDFAMIMGFPGRTDRYKTSFGVDYTMKVTNPVRIEVREKKLDLIKEYMNTSEKANIQYASKFQRSSNYYKYSIGQNKGLEDLDVIAKKQAIEKEFTDWVKTSPEQFRKYGNALTQVKEAYTDIKDEYAFEYMTEAIIRGPEIFSFVYRFRRLHGLLEKPEENKLRIKQAGELMSLLLDDFFKDYDARTDEKVAAALLKLYKKNVDPRFYPTFFNIVEKKFKGDFDKFASKMFSNTVFADKKKLEAFLKNPQLAILDKDMAFLAMISAFDKMEEIRGINNQTVTQIEEGNRLFLAGLMEMNRDKVFYPDANSTLRLTYGTVKDYEPEDGVLFKYYTTLEGYIQKEIQGDPEFNVPARLKELYEAKDFGPYAHHDGSLRTCFLTDNDTTGGNSGSPVINGKGELVGIAFDGNWEAMSQEMAFVPDLQRSIIVDIRFVLWIIDKYAGATNLIDEMTLID